MSKKALLSVLLIGVLAFGAGLGTFAWFTAQVTSTGNEFAVGTFELNEGTDVALGKIFDETELTEVAPGFESEVKEFTVTNTGSLPMFLRAELDLTVEDKNGNIHPENSNFVNKFEIKPVLVYDGHPYQAGWMSIGNLEAWLNNWVPDENGLEQHEFVSGDNFTVQFQIRLNNTANNDYQGSKITGNLTIQGRQAVADSQFTN